MENEILLIPEKEDVERTTLAKSWKAAGGTVQKIGKFWERPKLPNNAEITVYGNDTFVLVLAQVLNLELISPRDEIISELDKKWTRRTIELRSLSDLTELSFPCFIKPVKPKLFVSAIYDNLNSIISSTEGLDKNEAIICSEIIAIDCEVRAFILNNQICDLSYYEGSGHLDDAYQFISDFLTDQIILPQAYVLDIGYNRDKGWFIIEFNAAWGAGLNGCHPEKVMPCIRAASTN